MDIVIFGAGLVGVTLARHLSEQAHNVTLIDANQEVIRKVQETLDVRALSGNASNDTILKEAGLNTADLVFAVTDSDETNIVLTLIAHGENSKARIFARIRGEQYASKANLWRGERFNNTLIFNPERAAIEAVVQLLAVPNAFEVIPVSNGSIKLAGFRLGEMSPLVGRPLRELSQVGDDRPLIVAAERNGEVLLPSGETVLEAGNRVYVTWTRSTKLKKVYEFLGIKPPQGHRVLIVGGGRIGAGVAEGILQSGDASVTLIEKDLERCHPLVDRFPAATVVHGDATDMDLLRETTRHATTLVAVSGNQEVNFLLALMADQLGVPRVIPVLDNAAYISLAPQHGIDAVISPKLATVGEILGHLRKGHVLESAPMLDGRLHAFMVSIQGHSRLAHVSLAEAKIPQGILIAAVVLGRDVTVPNGRSWLQPGDQALILCATDQIRRMDDLLSLLPAA